MVDLLFLEDLDFLEEPEVDFFFLTSFFFLDFEFDLDLLLDLVFVPFFLPGLLLLDFFFFLGDLDLLGELYLDLDLRLDSRDYKRTFCILR